MHFAGNVGAFVAGCQLALLLGLDFKTVGTVLECLPAQALGAVEVTGRPAE